MSNSKWFDDLPKPVQTELEKALRRVRLGASSISFWERLLKPAERKQLGNDLKIFLKEHGGAGIIAVWRKLHGGTQPHAVVEIAYRLQHIDRQTHEWLLREIGEASKENDAPDVPNWDREKGRLTFRGKLARQIRVTKKSSNIQKIVEAFEEESWPNTIDNPLDPSQQTLHQALRSLNNGLKRLRFHAHKGAEAIYWELV